MRYKRRRRSHFGGIIKLFLLLAILGAGGFLAVKFGPVMLAGKFDASERFNIVLTTPAKTSLVSLDIKGNKATIVDFPSELYVPRVAHGYGQYPIGKVFEVGELDKRGGQVLSDTISLYLGVPVDGYVRLVDFSTTDLKSNLLSVNFILNAKSNVNLWDRILVVKSLMDLRFDRIEAVNLAKKSEALLLADGSSAKVLLEEDLDKLLDRNFVEKGIVREGFRVQIVNTTEQAGLGNAYARIISGLGATVIDVSSEPDDLSACRINASEKVLKSKTVKRIEKMLKCEAAKGDSGRADLILFLGRGQKW